MLKLRILLIFILFFFCLFLTGNNNEIFAEENATVWQWQGASPLSKVHSLSNVVSVAAGGDHNLALRADGTVWAWGSNQYGQLGNGASGNSSSEPIQVRGPVGVGYLNDIKSIAAGSRYSLALKKDGTVWVWGFNGFGVRGAGIGVSSNSAPPLLVPTQVKFGSNSYFANAIEIAAGNNYSLALKADGTVWAWGTNNDGELGIGCILYNCSQSFYPARVHNIIDVISIAAGGNHSLAVKSDGTVWGWGSTSGGQLANINPPFEDQVVPAQIQELSEIKKVSARQIHSLALGDNGKVFEWGGWLSSGQARYSNPRQIPDLDSVTSVSAGWSLNGGIGLAVKGDGTIWQWSIHNIIPQRVSDLSDVAAMSGGLYTPNLAVVGKVQDVLGDSATPTPTPTPSPTAAPTPTPAVEPFLDLPFDYHDQGSFEQVALHPESWFDHAYPLQNIDCCVQAVLTYTGIEENSPYRSHAGYDYASKNGVEHHTPVLAAYSGSAEFIPESESGGLGNVIKIDHGNKYQTWYGHLDPVGLIVSVKDVKIPVQKGGKIGETGFTGNVYPKNEYGAHIHFGVFKDSNSNNTFDDDYPFGLVDPLGWDEKKGIDPWTQYGSNRHGAESVNLFLAREPAESTQIPTTGGQGSTNNIQVTVPNGAAVQYFTLSVKNGPFESEDDLVSAMPSFFLSAIDSLGDEITQFFAPITITYSYADADLLNINEDTLKLYVFNETTHRWEPIPSTVNKANKTVTADTKHFSHFALMGEIKDSIAPITEASMTGDMREDGWYRSSVTVELDGTDNEGGLGIEDTLYTSNGSDWSTYSQPLVFEEEGEYAITYQSRDVVDNIEDQKTTTFSIDKTSPSSSSDITGTMGDNGWYTSSVSISLSAQDADSGIKRIEYSLDGGATYAEYFDPILISDEGDSEIFYRSIDKAGNVEEANKIGLKIDKTPPNTLVYKTGVMGSGNWYRSNVEVAFNAKDDASGFSKTYYSLSGEGDYQEYMDPLIISDEGVTEIFYYSIDNAGNVETHKDFEIKIDKTAPEAVIQYDMQKEDLVISGIDESGDPTIAQKDISKNKETVTITDKAGNFMIIDDIDRDHGTNSVISFLALTYNGDKTDLDRNRFYVHYQKDKNGDTKGFKQVYEVQGEEKIKLEYDPQIDKTFITKDGDKSEVDGLKFLKLSTQNGSIKYSY